MGSVLEVNRYVNVAYLTNLNSSTTYYFAVGEAENFESYSNIFKFKTTPSYLSKDEYLNFTSGGDLGLTETTEKLMKMAVDKEPGFIMFGGDLAYANGIPSCYRRWDIWLNIWFEYSISPSGNMIPMLTSIGNHEAGGFDQPRTNAPFYNSYFVHQSLNNISYIDRPTYQFYDVSGSLILALDSGIVTSVEQQNNFILSNIKNDYLWKMAIYHAPMYPSVRSYYNSLSSSMRQNWGKLFDQFNLDLSFENHDHAYKRTFPIYNEQPASNGTVYIGDGSMGVVPRDPDSISQRNYLAISKSLSFFIFVQISQTNISIFSIDSSGNTFDSYTINH